MASQASDTPLDFTGERVVPGKTPRPLVLEHLVRYRFALSLVNIASRVLDVGSGAGYGTGLLSEKAAKVVGIDNAWEAIQYARGNYRQRGLHFACADCRDLPFQDHSFDQVVLLEVIEHISEQARCVREIRRVLTPEGKLILSTPNPAGPMKAIDEANPFHKRELQEHELLELLRPQFGYVQLLYQYELFASSIEGSISQGNARSTKVVENASSASAPKYFVAVCSDSRPRIPSTRMLAMGGVEHLVSILHDLRQKEKDLINQRRDIDALLQWREDYQRESTKNLAAHQDVIRGLKEEVAALNARLSEEMATSNALREMVTRLQREIAALENQNASQRMELEWLYRWVPVNRLAYKFLYGKNLRRRILGRLGFKV